MTEAAVKALEIVCVSNTSLLRTAVLGVLLFAFCLSTLVGFLSTGEHLGRPMWGSGFGRSRDIKAQDVEKQRNKDPVTSFHGVGPFLL